MEKIELKNWKIPEKKVLKGIYGREWEVAKNIGEWAKEPMMKWYRSIKKYGAHEAEKVWGEVKNKGMPPAYLWRILHPKK